MAPLPDPTANEFDELLRQLTASARNRSTPAGYGTDDMVAEALLAVVAEPKPDKDLPLLVRARRKLCDRRAEIVRFQTRRDEPPQLELLENVNQSRDHGALDDLATFDVVRSVLGQDGEEYARYKCEGMTATDIAGLPGWNAQRVESVGRRMRRAKTQLLDALLRDA
jgi:hypothetical protein